MTPTWKHSKGTTSKYHAKHMVIDGHNFPSQKEAKRYEELKLMEKAGEIKGLKLQVAFPLVKKSEHGREIRYYADFVYYENGSLVVEDTKGFKTDVYKLKKRLMAELYGINIKET